MNLKILCLFDDDEFQFLAPEPEEIFADNEVVIAKTFTEAVAVLSHRAVRFDIVLADHIVKMKSACDEIVFSMSLAAYVRPPVKGIGIFLPSYCKKPSVNLYHERFVLVSDKTCMDPSDHRDWQRLFDRVNYAIAEFEL